MVLLVLVILTYLYMRRRARRLPTQKLLELKSFSRDMQMDVRVEGVSEPFELRRFLLDAMVVFGLSEADAPDLESKGGRSRASLLDGKPPRELETTRFSSSLQDLVMGEPEQAALGVVHMMRANPAEVRAGSVRGVVEIEAEFEAFLQSMSSTTPDHVSAPWWATVEAAKEAYECMHYCIHEAAGSSDLLFSNSPHGRDRDADGARADRITASGAGMRLVDFCNLAEAQTAKLEPAHVAALRVYTTAAFKVLNGPLRSPWGERAHPFPVTITFLSDAIMRLRSVGARLSSAQMEVDLWRGLRGRTASDAFMLRGGTERAPMSTTTNLRVALQYTQPESGGELLVFKLRTDSFMSRGSSLRWVSAFPGEDEILYPPLTYLKPTGRPKQVVRCNGGRVVTVIEVTPTLGTV